MFSDFKKSLMESMKEVALNHTINRPQSSLSSEPKPSTSGMNAGKRYNPMSDDESDYESDLGQYDDLDYE